MRDALHVFGLITLSGATTVYSADGCNLGTIDSKYRRSANALGLVPRLFAKFLVTTAPTAGTSFTLQVFGGASADPTTQIVEGATILIASATLGAVFTLALPQEVPQYIRVGATGVGAALDGALHGWLELGPNLS